MWFYSFSFAVVKAAVLSHFFYKQEPAINQLGKPSVLAKPFIASGITPCSMTQCDLRKRSLAAKLRAKKLVSQRLYEAINEGFS